MQHIEHNNVPEGSITEKIDDSQSTQLSYTYATIVNKLSDKYHFHPDELMEGIDGLPEAAQTIFHADNIDVIAKAIDPDTAGRYVSGNNIKTDTVQLGYILKKLGLDKERMHIGDIMKQLSMNYPDSFRRIEEGPMKGRYSYNLDGLKEIIMKMSFVKNEVTKNTGLTLTEIYKCMYSTKLIDSPVNQSLHISILQGLRNTYIAYNNQCETDIFKYTTIRGKPVLVVNQINKELAIGILKELLEKRKEEIKHQATRLENYEGPKKIAFYNDDKRYPPFRY